VPAPVSLFKRSLQGRAAADGKSVCSSNRLCRLDSLSRGVRTGWRLRVPRSSRFGRSGGPREPQSRVPL